MLGQANVCGPTLSGLGTNFGLEPLIGKRLAVISDARIGGKADQNVIVERVLAITGEDNLTIDRKNKSAWNGRLEARFMVLTNELPRLKDASGALANRFIILTMCNSFFGREDLALSDRLTGELPGILNWSIAGWERLQKRGHFVPPASSKAIMQDLEDLSSPVGAFLRERSVVEHGASCQCDVLYHAWAEWCREQNIMDVGTQATFGRDLHAAIPGLTPTRPRLPSGNVGPRHYAGIKLLYRA